MPGQVERIAPYGAAYNLYFSLEDPLAVGSDKFVVGTIAGLPIVAGDVTISKDGGAVANTTNLPTQVTAAQPYYALALTAAEMTATQIDIVLQDQTAGAAWRSLRIHIATKLEVGQINADATNIGGNVAGFLATGVGTAAGMKTKGGATGPGTLNEGGATSGSGLEATSATSGVGFKMTGAGAGNKSMSFVHASGAGDYTNLFDQLEGTEPAGAIATNASVMAILQRVKRRLGNKTATTSSSLTVYKDNSSTVLETHTITDDGTTFTKAKAT